jgi:hypothetical protein
MMSLGVFSGGIRRGLFLKKLRLPESQAEIPPLE